MKPSGSLHGLMRLRNFIQDDGHIFCTELQIHDEITTFIDRLESIYRDFGGFLMLKLNYQPALKSAWVPDAALGIRLKVH